MGEDRKTSAHIETCRPATASALDRAFRGLVAQLGADRRDAAAEERWRDINEAYEVLKLPTDLQALAVRNGLEIRHASFHADVGKLIAFLRARRAG